MLYKGQEVEVTNARIREIRLGAELPFTLFTEIDVDYSYHDTRYVMSEARAKKLAFVEAMGGKCLGCYTRFDLTIDHVIPAAMGGKSIMNNLQILCRYCNRTKDNKIIDYRSV